MSHTPYLGKEAHQNTKYAPQSHWNALARPATYTGHILQFRSHRRRGVLDTVKLDHTGGLI